MALRRGKNENAERERWLEVDASMTGSLTFKDPVNLEINGSFDGKLDTKGNLSIGERAQVKADIKGEVVLIAGTVQGDLNASQRVELSETARVTGNVRTPRIAIKDGAVLQGALDMSQAAAQGRWMTKQDLMSYLEVDEATVTQWAEDGRLPSDRQGGEWRFERAKVEEWVAQEKIK